MIFNCLFPPDWSACVTTPWHMEAVQVLRILLVLCINLAYCGNWFCFSNIYWASNLRTNISLVYLATQLAKMQAGEPMLPEAENCWPAAYGQSPPKEPKMSYVMFLSFTLSSGHGSSWLQKQNALSNVSIKLARTSRWFISGQSELIFPVSDLSPGNNFTQLDAKSR